MTEAATAAAASSGPPPPIPMDAAAAAAGRDRAAAAAPHGGGGDSPRRPADAPAPAEEFVGRTLKPLPRPPDPLVCQRAARYAVRVCEEMSKRSQLLAVEAPVPCLDRRDVLPFVGELLGKGGFNSVYELVLPRRHRAARTDADSGSSGDDDDHHHHHHDAPPLPRALQALLAGRGSGDGGSRPRLAVKFLSDQAMMEPEEFCNGAADLLMEAKYLTALAAHPHPSLIALHAVCAAGPDGFGHPGRAGYFIVIDRLYDTLDRRMDVWVELARRHRGGGGGRSGSARRRARALLLQRLLVCAEVAVALRHLHGLRLLFRDLKPDNVGFDYEGRVKLFDFGLAKELDPRQRNSNNLYAMSGGTGSRRFMAPEVALSEPYSLSADLYSFAILLWEVLMLRKAFAAMPVEEHRERVVKNDERPEVDPSWSSDIQSLIQQCWQRNPFDRPEAREVHKVLRQECRRIYLEEFAPKAPSS